MTFSLSCGIIFSTQVWCTKPTWPRVWKQTMGQIIETLLLKECGQHDGQWHPYLPHLLIFCVSNLQICLYVCFFICLYTSNLHYLFHYTILSLPFLGFAHKYFTHQFSTKCQVMRQIEWFDMMQFVADSHSHLQHSHTLWRSAVYRRRSTPSGKAPSLLMCFIMGRGPLKLLCVKICGGRSFELASGQSL